MKRYTFLILSALFFISVLVAAMPSKKTSQTEPDFSYPQTVIEEAEKQIVASTELDVPQGGIQRLNGLLKALTAMRMTDPQNLNEQLEFLHKHAQASNLTEADRALELAIKANLLNNYFRLNRWKINSREVPGDASDPTLWNASQFTDTIAALYRKAGELAADVDVTPYISTVLNQGDTQIFNTLGGLFHKWSGGKGNFSSQCEVGSAPFFYWLCMEQSALNAEDWLKLYDQYKQYEWSNFILTQIFAKYLCPDGVITPNTPDNKLNILRRQIVDVVTEAIKAHPNFPFNDILAAKRDRAIAPEMLVQLGSYVPVGKEFDIEFHSYNLTEAAVELVKLPSSRLSDKQRNNLPATVTINYKTDSVYSNQTERVVLPAPGEYTLRIKGSSGYRYMNDFTATEIVPVILSQENEAVALTTDFTSGKPVKGVAVSHSEKRSGLLGVTNADGVLRFAKWKDYDYWGTNLYFKYNNFQYSFNDNARPRFIGSSAQDDEVQYSINVLTDRALYHPGDSVAWVVVIGKRLRSGSRVPARDENVEVRLNNTNGEEVGALTVRTDAMGRANGTFAVPKDGLTGMFSIEAETDDEVAEQRIMVSDFKMPVFEVKVDSIDMTSELVTLCGKATTLSGMPVADAEVEISVEPMYRWNSTVLFETKTTTDFNGSFKFTIAKDSISSENKDFPMVANIKVTNRTAETTTVSKYFTFGKRYSLSASWSPGVYSTEKPIEFLVEATDINGNKAALDFNWKLLCDEKTVLSGTGLTGSKVIMDASDVSAGIYTLELIPSDTTNCNSFTAGNYTLYNIAKNLVPAGEALFLPQSTVQATKGDRSVPVTVGTPDDETFIYIVVANGHGIPNVEPVQLKKGYTTLSVPLEGNECPSIKLVSQKNGNTFIRNVEIVMAEPQNLKIEVESMRDKVAPGDAETWRLRISGPDAAGAAAVATMYNKALEQLESYRAGLSFNFYHRNPEVMTSTVYNYERTSTFSLGKDARRYFNVAVPELLYLNSGGTIMRKNIRIRGTSSSEYTAEAEEVLVGAVNGVQYKAEAQDYAAPMMAMAEADDLEEAEVATDSDGGSQPTDKDSYREPEVLQAFWMPRLVADKEGVVTVEFTVPDANTTWAFKMFAWTSGLLSANFNAEVLASKPVMVQSSTPRYLRQGDSATLSATVFNNSDSTALASTLFEIFDPTTGKIVDSHTASVSLPAKGSGIVTIDINAGAEQAALGYRVKATSGRYSDGEQGLIPVLPSSQMVVESQEFYLDSTGDPVTLVAPQAPDTRSTFQYCQNPIWTIVKALRAVDYDDSSLATAVAANIQTSALTAHILSSNPRIENVLREWKSNPDSKALTSMLNRNDDLKTLLLDQTPWVQAAASNTDRMAALTNALDADRCKYVISRATADLNKFRNADGGFRWAEWSGNESSEWVTVQILQGMGILNSLGAMPQELSPMMHDAFRWLEAKSIKAKPGSWIRSQYTFIASLFPGFTTSESGKKIIDAECKTLSKEWKSMNLSDKAYCALILNHFGHQPTARQIIASIEQFGKMSAGRGMEFPSVTDMRSYGNIIQAVATVTPGNPILNPMRQWVILQAQATDNLAALNPDYIIYSVLLTGSPWIDMTSVQPIRINGNQATFPQAELATGYLAQSIAPGTQVEVSPTGVTPSYGSIVSVFTAPMIEVKPVATSDLSISKRMMVKRDGKWVEATDFLLGEEVQVQLQITAKRQLEYVALTDERPAGFEPVDQMPGWLWSSGIGFYRENRNASTRIFIGYMPKGSYSITYSMTAATQGRFASGLATLQSQYDPALTAHSGGTMIKISK